MTPGLRLGFDPDFAPLTCVELGRPVGRAIDIVRSACVRAGIALELRPVGLGDRNGVAELRLDGFACMAVTPGRPGLTFSVPYLTTAAALFFGQRRGEQESGRAGGGVAVATPRAGPLYALLSESGEARGRERDRGSVQVARLVPGTDYVDCLRLVLSGEADAAALNAEVGRAMVARLFPGAFHEVPAPLPDLGLAVALTCAPTAAEWVLSRLDPALLSVAPGTSGPGPDSRSRR